MLLVKSFTVLLAILLFYHFFNVVMKIFKPSYKEGLETNSSPTPPALAYTDPQLNKDPTYIATINASNITFLKGQLDDLLGLKQTVTSLNQTVEKLTTKVDNNSQAITALGETLKNTSQQLTGRDVDSKEPLPQATGLNYGNMSGVQNSF